MAQGDLFEAVITHHDIPRDPRVPLLIWWAARLSELGLTPSYGPGDHGNLSCRTPDGLLVTARATTKSRLRPEDVVEIVGVDRTPSGVLVRCRGARLPSTDTLLHLTVYQRRPDIHAILHGHDAHALAKAHELKLPMTSRSAARASHALIEEICELVTRDEYVLLRDHGFLALGRSLDDAGELVRRWCRHARSV